MFPCFFCTFIFFIVVCLSLNFIYAEPFYVLPHMPEEVLVVSREEKNSQIDHKNDFNSRLKRSNEYDETNYSSISSEDQSLIFEEELILKSSEALNESEDRLEEDSTFPKINNVSINCTSNKKGNLRQSSSFAVNTTSKEPNVDGKTHGLLGIETKAKETTSIHVGEDATLCWIETVTIKEDLSFRPPKRLVLREYAISFENSATIPERYLDCHKLEGEITSNSSEIGKTAIFEIIDENTKVSRLVNFTTVSYVNNTKVWQYRIVKCGMGPVVSEHIIDYNSTSKDNAKSNPKKRVEIKVSPKMNRLFVAKPVEQEKITKDFLKSINLTNLVEKMPNKTNVSIDADTFKISATIDDRATTIPMTNVIAVEKMKGKSKKSNCTKESNDSICNMLSSPLPQISDSKVPISQINDTTTIRPDKIGTTTKGPVKESTKMVDNIDEKITKSITSLETDFAKKVTPTIITNFTISSLIEGVLIESTSRKVDTESFTGSDKGDEKKRVGFKTTFNTTFDKGTTSKLMFTNEMIENTGTDLAITLLSKEETENNKKKKTIFENKSLGISSVKLTKMMERGSEGSSTETTPSIEDNTTLTISILEEGNVEKKDPTGDNFIDKFAIKETKKIESSKRYITKPMTYSTQVDSSKIETQSKTVISQSTVSIERDNAITPSSIHTVNTERIETFTEISIPRVPTKTNKMVSESVTNLENVMIPKVVTPESMTLPENSLGTPVLKPIIVLDGKGDAKIPSSTEKLIEEDSNTTALSKTSTKPMIFPERKTAETLKSTKDMDMITITYPEEKSLTQIPFDHTTQQVKPHSNQIIQVQSPLINMLNTGINKVMTALNLKIENKSATTEIYTDTSKFFERRGTVTESYQATDEVSTASWLKKNNSVLTFFQGIKTVQLPEETNTKPMISEERNEDFSLSTIPDATSFSNKSVQVQTYTEIRNATTIASSQEKHINTTLSSIPKSVDNILSSEEFDTTIAFSENPDIIIVPEFLQKADVKALSPPGITQSTSRTFQESIKTTTSSQETSLNTTLSSTPKSVDNISSSEEFDTTMASSENPSSLIVPEFLQKADVKALYPPGMTQSTSRTFQESINTTASPQETNINTTLSSTPKSVDNISSSKGFDTKIASSESPSSFIVPEFLQTADVKALYPSGMTQSTSRTFQESIKTTASPQETNINTTLTSTPKSVDNISSSEGFDTKIASSESPSSFIVPEFLQTSDVKALYPPGMTQSTSRTFQESIKTTTSSQETSLNTTLSSTPKSVDNISSSEEFDTTMASSENPSSLIVPEFLQKADVKALYPPGMTQSTSRTFQESINTTASPQETNINTTLSSTPKSVDNISSSKGFDTKIASSESPSSFIVPEFLQTADVKALYLSGMTQSTSRTFQESIKTTASPQETNINTTLTSTPKSVDNISSSKGFDTKIASSESPSSFIVPEFLQKADVKALYPPGMIQSTSHTFQESITTTASPQETNINTTLSSIPKSVNNISSKGFDTKIASSESPSSFIVPEFLQKADVKALYPSGMTQSTSRTFQESIKTTASPQETSLNTTLSSTPKSVDNISSSKGFDTKIASSESPSSFIVPEFLQKADVKALYPPGMTQSTSRTFQESITTTASPQETNINTTLSSIPKSVDNISSSKGFDTKIASSESPSSFIVPEFLQKADVKALYPPRMTQSTSRTFQESIKTTASPQETNINTTLSSTPKSVDNISSSKGFDTKIASSESPSSFIVPEFLQTADVKALYPPGMTQSTSRTFQESIKTTASSQETSLNTTLSSTPKSVDNILSSKEFDTTIASSESPSSFIVPEFLQTADVKALYPPGMTQSTSRTFQESIKTTASHQETNINTTLSSTPKSVDNISSSKGFDTKIASSESPSSFIVPEFLQKADVKALYPPGMTQSTSRTFQESIKTTASSQETSLNTTLSSTPKSVDNISSSEEFDTTMASSESPSSFIVPEFLQTADVKAYPPGMTQSTSRTFQESIKTTASPQETSLNTTLFSIPKSVDNISSSKGCDTKIASSESPSSFIVPEFLQTVDVTILYPLGTSQSTSPTLHESIDVEFNDTAITQTPMVTGDILTLRKNTSEHAGSHFPNFPGHNLNLIINISLEYMSPKGDQVNLVHIERRIALNEVLRKIIFN